MSPSRMLRSTRGAGREALAHAILAAGYTLTSLAKEMGKSRQVLSQWVRKTSTPSEADQATLAILLRVSEDVLGELLDDDRSDLYGAIATASPRKVQELRRALGLKGGLP